MKVELMVLSDKPEMRLRKGETVARVERRLRGVDWSTERPYKAQLEIAVANAEELKDVPNLERQIVAAYVTEIKNGTTEKGKPWSIVEAHVIAPSAVPNVAAKK